MSSGADGAGQDASKPRLILIEGLPGSGKTSLAEWLCGHIENAGHPVVQIPELASDHPVTNRATLRTAGEPGFADASRPNVTGRDPGRGGLRP